MKVTSKKASIVGLVLVTIAIGLSFAYAIGLFHIVFPRDAVYGATEPATRTAVLKIIPLGSRIAFAKSAMEERGFHCVMMYNQSYSGYDPTYTQPARSDFLWCDSGELLTGPLITKRWQVIFVMKEEAVIAVAVGIGLTAP